MQDPILELEASSWRIENADPEWLRALEAGRVLYFPRLAFVPTNEEKALIRPESQSPGTRSITLDASGRFKGFHGDDEQAATMSAMIGRFRQQAEELLSSLAPSYGRALRFATTSYRPLRVETREQSWRADDKRMHVDAFAGRPNHGERILRVFSNVNPEGVPRVWRVGEPFESLARRFLPDIRPYNRWEARRLRLLMKTKSIRSEYDHIMLELHDRMKSDPGYQQSGDQISFPFAAGSTWVCFSDQTVHAAMSGQHMMEQTLHLPVADQHDPASSPLAILSRLTGRTLV